jgi:ribosomal protein S12 methylthiotransferase accessory factor
MLHGISGLNEISVSDSEPLTCQDFVGSPEQTLKQQNNGTHRVRRLEETLSAARSAAQLAGMSRLTDLTGLDCLGIPVFSSIRPQAETNNLTITGGKGYTPVAAEISALLEAVERYCGERNNRVGLKTSFAQLSQEKLMLDPYSLILAQDHNYHHDADIEWWPARDLLSDEVILVPAVAVLHPYNSPPNLFNSSSNGLACGNSLPEAVLHGLLEVIERDATSFGEALLEGPILDLDSLTDVSCAQMVQKFKSAGLQTQVRIFTTEINIPTFYAIVDDTIRRDPMLINGGFGCHLDPCVGLSRALTESALSRATVIAGARDDLDREQVKREIGYDTFKSQFSDWFKPQKPTVRLEQFPNLSTENITEDICFLLDKLNQAGFKRVLAVDLSIPNIDFAVARVIVPGAELNHIQPNRLGLRLRQKLT